MLNPLAKYRRIWSHWKGRIKSWEGDFLNGLLIESHQFGTSKKVIITKSEVNLASIFTLS
jgi:hypothetical protein